MRLAILVSHPVQYFAPVFRKLNQFEDLEVKVFFGCDHGMHPQKDPNFGVVFKWDCEPTSGYEHEFISHLSLSSLEGLSGVRLAYRAFSEINRFKPDRVLIFAYTPAFIMASTFLLKMFGHSLMLRAETTDEALPRSPLKDRLRKAFLSFYYRQFSHVFPIGTNSIRHYSRMGVSEELMTAVNYAIDVDFFQKQVEFWLPQRSSLRSDMGIGLNDHVLLYCGKMFPPKDPLLIPKALDLLKMSEKNRLWFIAVGDGELRPDFERLMNRELAARSLFVGFKNQSELGQYYAISDTLLLPSQSGETWGLVVNEALQFGLKVVVSDKVGSSKDLVKDSIRGHCFKSSNVKALSNALSMVMQPAAEKDENCFTLPHPSQLAQAVYTQLLH